jgi:hypothetical protein
MKNKVLLPFKFVITIIIAFAVLEIFGYAQNVYAKEHLQWSLQQRIPGLGNDVLTPYLIADKNRTVHAFTSDWVGETNQQLAVLYLNWKEERGWTYPVDIILPQRGQARTKGIFLDTKGIFHLAYFDGDDRSGGIYYSRAYAANSGEARAWAPSQEVGRMAITPDDAILIGTDLGNLSIVYLGGLDGRGLYSVHSDDEGHFWSEPYTIYLTENEDLWPSSLDAAIDQENIIHLVWTVRTTDRTNSEMVYYARLNLEIYEWSEPFLLAELEDELAWSASIIEHKRELFVIYHDDDPTTRWMRRSQDGGINWTQPVRLFDHVGSNGAASLIVDGKEDLHMIFGNRIGWPSIHGLWFSTWDGYRWDIPSPIVSGPRIIDNSRRFGFDPSFPSLVISQGNTILVVWRTDPGAGPNGIWYSYTITDSPEEELVPLPSFSESIRESSESIDPTPVSDFTPNTIDNTANLPAHNSTEEVVSLPNPLLYIFLGFFPVIVLITGYVGFTIYRKKR